MKIELLILLVLTVLVNISTGRKHDIETRERKFILALPNRGSLRAMAIWRWSSRCWLAHLGRHTRFRAGQLWASCGNNKANCGQQRLSDCIQIRAWKQPHHESCRCLSTRHTLSILTRMYLSQSTVAVKSMAHFPSHQLPSRITIVRNNEST